MNKEPIILGLAPALVTGLITALANVLHAFGFGDITQAQIDSLNQAAVTLMFVLAALGTWWGRSRVTPVAAPVLPHGTPTTAPDGTSGVTSPAPGA